jgi:hypothetical protein
MRLLVPVVQQSKTERRVATKLNTPTSPVTKCPHRVLKQAEWSRTPSCAQDERPPWIGVKHDHLVAQDERPPAHGVKLFDLVPQAKGPPLLGFKQSQGDLLPPTHSVKLFDLVPQAKGPPHLGVKQLQRASLPPRPQTSPSTKRPNESSPEPTTRNRKQRTVTAPCGLDPSAPNLRTRACAERNATRFEQASREDTKTTGENQGQPLAPNPKAFLPEPVFGPDDSFSGQDWFLKDLQNLAKMPCPVPRKPDVQFDVPTQAAQHNTDLLCEHNYDVAKLLATQHGTTLDFESKFRPAKKL